MIIASTDQIKNIAAEKDEENLAFKDFLKNQPPASVDKLVHQLNEQVSALIDCTTCGNCCRSLMINITQNDVARLGMGIGKTVAEIKQTFTETSGEGDMIMKEMPCHFLAGNKCTVYEHRFTECREFPHLHKPGFTNRLFGTMMNYAICPIVFNVVEQLKKETGFIP